MITNPTGEIPAAAGQVSPRTVVIRPQRGFFHVDFRELWDYRELTYILAQRDVSVRYKQTILGVLWVVLQPVALTLIFTLIFGVVARVPTNGVPYPIFVFTGLLPWQLFSRALLETSNSVVASETLITKVFFPRLIIPIAATSAALVDFAVSLGVLVVLLAVYQVVPASSLWSLPLFVVLAFTTALGVGLWLAALNVEFRDVRYTLPFLTQLWFFATPIAYPGAAVPGPWNVLIALNPMTAIVDGFRWAILGSPAPDVGLLALSAFVSVVILIGGIVYFKRMERSFADVI